MIILFSLNSDHLSDNCCADFYFLVQRTYSIELVKTNLWRTSLLDNPSGLSSTEASSSSDMNDLSENNYEIY